MLLSQLGKVVTHETIYQLQDYYLQPEANGKTHLGRCSFNSVTSPVDGQPTPPDQLEFCSVKRMPTDKDCGLTGLLYQEKESNHV